MYRESNLRGLMISRFARIRRLVFRLLYRVIIRRAVCGVRFSLRIPLNLLDRRNTLTLTFRRRLWTLTGACRVWTRLRTRWEVRLP